MTKPITRKLRCGIYTRKSTEEGLEQEFNSLHAQREACEAYVASQRSEGWALIREPYDDGGFSGGTLERPALKRLLADIEEGLIDVVVVYKIDLVQVGPDVARHLGRVEGDARVGALHQHLVAIGVLAGFVALVHPHGAEVQTLHALSLRADDGTLPPPALLHFCV